MTKPSVELVPAFCWTCEECGREQFARTIVYEPESPEEESELRDDFGIEPWQEGIFQTMPEKVKCECGEEFSTQAFGG